MSLLGPQAREAALPASPDLMSVVLEHSPAVPGCPGRSASRRQFWGGGYKDKGLPGSPLAGQGKQKQRWARREGTRRACPPRCQGGTPAAEHHRAGTAGSTGQQAPRIAIPVLPCQPFDLGQVTSWLCASHSLSRRGNSSHLDSQRYDLLRVKHFERCPVSKKCSVPFICINPHLSTDGQRKFARGHKAPQGHDIPEVLWVALAEGRGSKTESEPKSCGGREDKETSQPKALDHLSAPPSDHKGKRCSGPRGHCSESHSAPLPQHTAVLVRQKDDAQINITEAAFMARRGRLHRYLGVSHLDRGECKQTLQGDSSAGEQGAKRG